MESECSLYKISRKNGSRIISLWREARRMGVAWDGGGRKISILYQQSERRCGVIQLCNERILECRKHVLVIGCGCDG